MHHILVIALPSSWPGTGVRLPMGQRLPQLIHPSWAGATRQLNLPPSLVGNGEKKVANLNSKWSSQTCQNLLPRFLLFWWSQSVHGHPRGGNILFKVHLFWSWPIQLTKSVLIWILRSRHPRMSKWASVKWKTVNWPTLRSGWWPTLYQLCS